VDFSGRFALEHEHRSCMALNVPPARGERLQREPRRISDMLEEAEVERDRTHVEPIEERGGPAAPVPAVEAL
jgi:hypothetical protein